MADLQVQNNRVVYLEGDTVSYKLPTVNPFGNESYTVFGLSTSFSPGGSVPNGTYFKGEAVAGDSGAGSEIEVSVTISEGYTKNLITLDASIANITDPTTEYQVMLERKTNGSNATDIKSMIFPVANTFFGSQYFQFIDVHGASVGDTVSYKLRADMDGYSNEAGRVFFGICGDTFGAREI